MLNSSIDIDQLHKLFMQNGFVSVPSILQEAAAREIHQTLSGLEWNLELQDQAQPPRSIRIPVADIHSNDTLAAILDAVGGQLARDDMLYMRICANADGFNHPILIEFKEYLNSDAFLEPMRAITGEKEVGQAWVEATCYDKYCFLMTHDDSHIAENRVAYVLNLTPVWRMEWGGILNLFRNDDMIPVLLPPLWNTLNLFSVPALHFVSSVSPTANEKRYAMTGWLRP